MTNQSMRWSNAKAGDEGVVGSARGGRAPCFQLHRSGLAFAAQGMLMLMADLFS